MFENLFNKRISTQNLYIARLKQCVAIDLMKDKPGLIYKFKDLECTVLVRKITKYYRDYYEDIFTKTLYKFNPETFEVEDICLYKIKPVVLTKPYITYKAAIKAYNELNNLSQESEKANKFLQKRKKR